MPFENKTAPPSLLSILVAEEFPKDLAQDFVHSHLWLTNIVGCAYIVGLFTLKAFMDKRAAFQLLWSLRFWNISLAVFSTLGMVNLFPELFHVIQENGFQGSYCKSYDYAEGNSGRWMFLFCLSKMVELGDTAFLLLRKKPVKFLHWFHHSATLIFTFYTYQHVDQFGPMRYGTVLNLSVHSFMYSYFCLMTSATCRDVLPTFIPMLLTTVQIGQFVFINAILVHLGILVHLQGVNCDFHPSVFIASLLMFGAYMLLFLQLFVARYVGKKKEESSASKNNKKEA